METPPAVHRHEDGTQGLTGRLFRRIAWSVGLAVVAFGVIPAAVLGYSLMRAQQSLASAADSLRNDDLGGARAQVDRAVSAASSARSVTEAPLLGHLASILGLRGDLEAVGVLAEVLGDGAGAAAAVLDQTGSAPDDGSSLAATLYDDGRIDLDAVRSLELALASARDVLGRALEALVSAPDPDLGIVADALERARSEVREVGPAVQKAASVLALVPRLAAEGGSRRYLLAFQSPSEARGGGGLLGVYGVLDVRDGRLSLSHVGPIEELVEPFKRAVSAPGWFDDLYGNFRATKEFRMVNLSPHFPTTAEIWLDMYRRIKGIRLDGVLALDPIALGELTAGTGPLQAEGWDRKINRENVRRVLLHDVYRHFDYEERVQNRYLRNLIDVFWERLESPELRASALLRGLGKATRKQHFKMFSTRAAEQSLLADLGVAGDYRSAGRSIQLLFNNNFAANKVDYFLHRASETTVTLHEDGSATVDVRLTLENQAPAEPGSVLVRPLRDKLPSGINDMTLYLLLPRGARPTSLRVNGIHSNILEGSEGAYPVAWQLIAIEPEDKASVHLTYRWPAAVTAGSFELTLWPQATARPDTYSLKVIAPPGAVIAGPGFSGQSVTERGILREPFSMSLRVSFDGEA